MAASLPGYLPALSMKVSMIPLLFFVTVLQWTYLVFLVLELAETLKIGIFYTK